MGCRGTASSSRHLLHFFDVSLSCLESDLSLIPRSISKLLDKMNTFPCTQYIEEGCLALREKAEFRTDKDLYHVIRLQRIIETIDKIATSTGSDGDTQSAYLHVRGELEEFRAYLCSDVSDSRKSGSPELSRSITKPPPRSALHAVSYRQVVSVPGGFLRAKPPTISIPAS